MKMVKRVLKIKATGKSRTFKANQGWRTIAGRRIYFRSGWEVSYAKHLQWLKEQKQILEWEHEPKTFWFEEIKRGTRSYLPDFKVTRPDGTHYWIEVKGYMDKKSVTKLKRMRKYYPQEQIYVIDSKWFQQHRAKFPLLTEQWENEFTEGE
jgi:hypothetical protein